VRADDGTLECWGGDVDEYGQVASTPTGIAFASVSAGGMFSCALRADNRHVLCWGRDDDAQVSSAPTCVAFASVSAGYGHACGVRADDGAIVCWGRDEEGQVSGGP
jgi:hypothetical protein